MRPLVSLPSRSQVSAQPSQGPLTICGGVEAGNSEPITGVHPSGNSAFTMSAMHDRLKARHLKSWLQLIENVGSMSTLFNLTTNSPLAHEHRVKAVAHYMLL